MGKLVYLNQNHLKQVKMTTPSTYRWSLFLVMILSLLLCACQYKPPLSAEYSILDEQPDGTPLSSIVLLIADNQLHHLYGDSFWMRSEFADKLVRSAIRPVQLDLYGNGLLKWVLERYGPRLPVIHLGDALDLACTEEFNKFVEIMEGAMRGWVMAPGNHDGYLFGNIHGEEKNWSEACARGGKPMTKNAFVKAYLDTLVRQNETRCQALAQSLNIDKNPLPEKGNWRYNGKERSFLSAVAWHINNLEPWRSYIIQEVNLTSLHSKQLFAAILLDTTQYQEPPTLIPSPLHSRSNAGLTGELLEDQLKILADWLKLGRNSNQIAVLMGHHPYIKLNKNARDAIDRFREKERVILYVSAHTHDGQYIVQGSDRDTWLELNIGSILDWPAEFRTMQFLLAEDTGRIVVRTPLFRLYEVWSNESDDVPDCEEEWEARPGDKDYYLTYMDDYSPNPEETQNHLMDVLLHSYKRLLKVAPTETSTYWPPDCTDDKQVIAAIDEAIKPSTSLNTKIELLVNLDRFESVRLSKDIKIHKNFRLCQALWASKYDHIGTRSPQVDNWFITFPKE